MSLRSILHFAPAAAVFAAVFLFVFVMGGPSDRVFILVWILFLLGGIAVCRGRGRRCPVVSTLVSVVVISAFSVYLIPRFPDQVIRKHVAEALPLAGILLAGPLFAITLIGGIGFFLGEITRSTVERRPVWFIGSLLGMGCFVLLMVLAIGPLVAATQMPRQPPPPLGIDDYQQCREAPIADATADKAVDVENVKYEELQDVVYGPYGRSNMLDLYLPKGAPRPMPLVVYIHGGGWCSGDKTKGDEAPPKSWWMPLVKRGFAVASINYRLTRVWEQNPETDGQVAAQFPAQIQDCKAAIRYLRAHATEYGLDPEKVGVMGHSAGGHLAALVAVANDVAEFDADGGNRDQSSRVQAVVSLAGIVDLRVLEKQMMLNLACMNVPNWEYFVAGMPNDPVPSLLGSRVDQNMELAAKASPVTHVSKDDPPILLVHGFRDGNVPVQQVEYFYCLLRQAGVDAEFMPIPGLGHSLSKDPQVGHRIEEFFTAHLAK